MLHLIRGRVLCLCAADDRDRMRNKTFDLLVGFLETVALGIHFKKIDLFVLLLPRNSSWESNIVLQRPTHLFVSVNMM